MSAEERALASEEIVVERRGSVLVVRINRPEARNALNGAVLNGLGRAVAEAEGDASIRALVLTGTGDKAFCAGMDLREFAGGGQRNLEPGAMDAFMRLQDGKVAVAVIGAANATAAGGGFELLLGCDLIVASSQAKFGLPEVKRGLYPGGSGCWVGTRVPLSIAMELVLTGDLIDAQLARELGLVNAVVEPDQVLDTALAYAERIAANGPLGLAAIKELTRLAVTDPGRIAERKQYWQPTVFGSEDAKEGASAFVEKRAPVWKGC